MTSAIHFRALLSQLLNNRSTSVGKKYGLQSVRVFVLCIMAMLAVNKAGAQLAASFTVDDTAGCYPVIVSCHNTSTGATSYTWDLGNGATSALTDAGGAYLTAGTYTVTLVAHNGSATSTATAVIKVYSPPTVFFSASDTTACPGSAVTFTSTTIAGSWGALTYSWNFGDGIISAAAAPSHAYASPGYYPVTLFATNGKGCSNSLTKLAYIHVLTPAAISFTAPVTSFCKAPAHVTFNNTSTGTAPITYNWDFGDGTAAATTASPAHTYTAPGSYSVRVIATDGKGCKDTLLMPNYISVGNLTAAFTPVATACGGAPVTFHNTSSTHISSQWFFGDGSTSVADDGVYAYPLGGTYTVKLVVFDGTCYDTTTHSITISHPTGSFTTTPARPCPPPAALTFTATASAGSTVSWLFDGGATATGPTAVHTFTTNSIYSNSMILTNSSGCKDTVTVMDTLYSLNINPSPIPASGCAPLTSTFSCFIYGSTYDPLILSYLPPVAYPSAISTYSWNFGDGSPVSASASPSHTYTAAGIYTATLTVTTANGCTATNTTIIKVGVLQTASFTLSPTHLCAGRPVAFHSTSTSTSLIDGYTWDFGDGQFVSVPAINPNPTHVYTLPGVHRPSLTVSYNGCGSHAFTAVDTVDSPSAVLHYTYDCIPGNGISFADSSLGDNSHLWTFGDGATSTLANIDHMYPALSTYMVSLSTYNAASGCRDTVAVLLNLAKAIITYLPFDSLLCKDQSDTINANISIRTAAAYAWYDNGVIVNTNAPPFIDTFHTVGTHAISLIIKDNFGCYDTSRSLHVLCAKPADSFSFTPPAGCGPLAVNFTDHTTDVTGATLSTHVWDFGDGIIDTTASAAVIHSYTASGSYTVKEIVTDNIGCKDTFTSSFHPLVHKPVAAFSASISSVCAGVAVHFTNTSAGIASSLWLFGDGFTSTATSPSHAYGTPGAYTVKLIVYDSFGCPSDTVTLPGAITVNFSPSASFLMSDSFAVCPPLNVVFSNTTTGAVSYTWFFGDGTTSTAPSPSDVYVSSGLYNVRLVATAANGCTDTARHNASIFGYSGAFSYTPVAGCSPLTVRFSSAVSHVSSIFWDFSDGATAVGATTDTIPHTYHSGVYLPKLVLIDSFGCRASSYGADSIKVDSIVPGFSFVPSTPCQSSATTFHDLSSGFFPMTAWTWTFASGATSTLSTPSYTYSTSGTKTVSLTVADSVGCTATITHTLTVTPGALPITGPSSFCRGTPAGLSDGPTVGTWTSSNTSVATIDPVSGMVMGVATGTATITFTPVSGCATTKAITVNASPSSISGVGSMCVGVTSAYTDSVSGGTWSITPVTVASVSATGIVRGITAGTATLSYTVGSCSAVKTITINPSPSVITGPSTVCVGTSITLADSIGVGTWSTTGTFVTVGSGTGIVTGSSSGTAIITYSLGLGCTKTKTVTVNPFFPIAGHAGVCIGSNDTLSDPGGGTWSSTNTAVGTVGVLSGIVRGLSAGTTIIHYTLGTCTANFVVSVNGLPGPVAGPSHVCAGDSITLTDTTGGGLWSVSSHTTVAIGSSSGVVTGIAGGTAIITYSLGSTTGCTKYDTITVIPGLAVPAGTASVCVGGTTTLADASAGGSWSGSSPSVALVGSATGVVTAVAPGTDTITYTMPLTGCSVARVVTVNALPAAISGSSTVCISYTDTLTDSTAGCTWSTASTGIATVGAATGVVTGVSAGPAIITCTSAGGCRAIKTVTVNSEPASIFPALPQVCVGTTTVLTDASPGGSWISSDLSKATIGASGIVSGLVPGIDTITYSIGAGCTTHILLTVNSFPGGITGPAHVCVGSTVTLTDGPAGGKWSSSNSLIAAVDSLSGVVTGMYAGSALITYSLGGTCIAMAPMLVQPLPSATIGRSYVCLGDTTRLTDPATGGVWSSSTAAATVSSTGLVTGVSSGGATISYTAGSGCAATRVMTVIAVPAISGITPLCAWGDTLHISDSATTGLFASSLITVVNLGGGNGKLIAHAPGIATVTYFLPTGCLITATVTVNTLPNTIAGSTHLCTGLTTVLTDTSAGGVWSSAGSSVISVGTATGVITGVAAGTAMVTYTLPATGCYTDTVVTVSPLPSPIAGPSAFCARAPSLYTDTTAGGVWSSSSPAIASVGSATGAAYGLASGTSTISYSIGSYCVVTKPITVNALPAIFITTGGGAYCSGDPGATVLLTGSQTGVGYQLYNGTTAIGAVMYGASAGADVSFGPLPGVGTYTITAVDTATSCASAMVGSATVSINPLPASYLVTGGGSYCAGGAGMHVGISSTGTGISYQLFRDGLPAAAYIAGTGAALDFGIFTTPGVYKVKAVNAVTGCSDYMADSEAISITPTVAPSVSISVSPGDTLCAGISALFTATAVNGGSLPVYRWKVNSSGGAAGAAYTYSPANGDIISVMLTSNAICALPDTAFASVTMTIAPQLTPVVTITATPGTTLITGQTGIFAAAVTNAGTAPTYQWEVNGHAIPGATNDTFTYSAFSDNDVVTCVVLSNGPCGGISGSKTLTITVTDPHVGVGIVANTANIIVLPNPSRGEFTIKGKLPSATDQDVTLELANMLGQIVYKNKISAPAGMIDTRIYAGDKLASGVYLLNVRSDNQSSIFHVVIER